MENGSSSGVTFLASRGETNVAKDYIVRNKTKYPLHIIC